MRARAAIIGVGHSSIYRTDEVPLGQLALEAARNAAADAGIDVSQVDGLFTPPRHPADGGGNADGINWVGTMFMQRALHLNPAHVDHGGVLATQSLVQAANAVAAGQCEYALVWRGLQNPGGKYGAVDPAVTSLETQFRFPYGYTVISQPAMILQRHMAKYGSTREQLGKFVVRNRNAAVDGGVGYWAQFKPKKLTLDDYMADRMISAPVGLLDCDIPIQFVGAYIVTSAERAQALGQPAAYIRGAAIAPTAYNQHYTNGFGESMEEWQASGRMLGQRLWQQAGFGPEGVDVLNLYDGFSVIAPFWAEGLGFCEPGEGLAFMAEPDRPLNPSTGNLGWGRTHGYALIWDSVLQVRGKAGARQVPGARTSVATASSTVQGGAMVFSADPE